MWNPLFKSPFDTGEEVDATRRRQIDLANYRGPKWAEMANDANAQFWDYAGKNAPATAAAAAQSFVDPSVAALRNQGALGVAGLEQGGANSRATEAALTALRQTGMEQRGAGQRADTQANASLGVAGIGADAARDTTGAEVAGRSNVEKLRGGYGLDIARAESTSRAELEAARSKAEMNQLLNKLAGDRANTLSNNETDKAVAAMRNQGYGGDMLPAAAGAGQPPPTPAGAGQPPPTPAGAPPGWVDPKEGEWKRMDNGEMRQWLKGKWTMPAMRPGR